MRALLSPKSREYIILAWCVHLPCFALLLLVYGSHVHLYAANGAIPLGPAEEARDFEWTMREFATSSGVEGAKRMKGKWLRVTVVNELERRAAAERAARSDGAAGRAAPLAALSDVEVKSLCMEAIAAPFRALLVSHHLLDPVAAKLVPYATLRSDAVALLRRRDVEGTNFRGRKLNRMAIDRLHDLARKHTKTSVLARQALHAALPPARYVD
jgi:hypothetical protein